jgi:NAD(P)-dependent dehydrogenase (short-subunit alcohol dehydrogenase family)
MALTIRDTYGQLDILVNNAGVGIYKSVLDTTSEEWDRCLDIDLKGVFLCSKYVIPHMQELGKGAIINISSVHSHATVNGVAPYAASKGGITALTRNMAIDYGPIIRVNTISPGWVLTPLIESIFIDPKTRLRSGERLSSGR